MAVSLCTAKTAAAADIVVTAAAAAAIVVFYVVIVFLVVVVVVWFTWRYTDQWVPESSTASSKPVHVYERQNANPLLAPDQTPTSLHCYPCGIHQDFTCMAFIDDSPPLQTWGTKCKVVDSLDESDRSSGRVVLGTAAGDLYVFIQRGIRLIPREARRVVWCYSFARWQPLVLRDDANGRVYGNNRVHTNHYSDKNNRKQ